MEQSTIQSFVRFSWLRVPSRLTIWIVVILVFLVVVSVCMFLLSPPRDFPVHEMIEIEEGTGLRESAELLEERNVVRSSLLLQTWILVRYPNEGLKAGTYIFPEPFSLPRVARAVALGTHSAPPLVITIHEGLRIEQIDALVAERLPAIEEGEILALTEGKEGYLFPDTYFVPQDYEAEAFVDLLQQTFETRIQEVLDQVDTSGYTLDEVVTMASILEREANTEESMKKVAGILWKRMHVGMPLQVDAAFEYVLDKSGTELTFDDLEIDSPYNTYRNRGLPPTPIANPGLDAIRAALDPIATPYWFYLTGNDGIFRYAETFEGHRQNRALYLD